MKSLYVNDLPTLSNISNFWERYEHLTHRVATYVVSGVNDGRRFPIISRLSILRDLIANGDKPFYASDLFGTSDSLGGIINGLSIHGIIKPTGNVREGMVPMGGDMYRRCEIKEWQLVFPVIQFENAYKEIRTIIIANI